MMVPNYDQMIFSLNTLQTFTPSDVIPMIYVKCVSKTKACTKATAL